MQTFDLMRRGWRGIVGPSGWRSVAGPAAFAVLAIALLVFDHLSQRVGEAVFWMTLALIVAIFARILETNRRQSRALEERGRDAQCDQVTGLRNRSRLEADIELAADSTSGGWILVLLELDGLQAYNDRLGYAAGDRLLREVAGQLVDAVAALGGSAYRVAASRLAALVPADERGLGEIVLAATASLHGASGDAPIGSAYGEVAVPDDADEPQLALRIASQRLMAHRQRQHRSARSQAHAVLMAALAARHPELRDELRVAASRAIALARRLGLDRDEIHDVALAAELQGVGLLAVPEVVIENELRIAEREPGMPRNHPLEGERIVAAAPGLAPVARLVRATSEHFDGTGQPDGLAGESIPLGSRIVAAAAAFAAITTPRPYRAALGAEEALGQLRRGAGGQFDPRVVAALVEDLTEELPPVEVSSV